MFLDPKRNSTTGKVTHTGRRANRVTGSVLTPEEVAPKLNKDQPLFRMRSGGTYAVQTSPKLIDGTIEDVPSNFIRLDKPRGSAKIRKRLKRAARKLAEQEG